jgi:predicted RNA-binding protein associated with RNAse of E/G family
MDMDYFTPEQVENEWIRIYFDDGEYIYFQYRDENDNMQDGYCDLVGFKRMQEGAKDIYDLVYDFVCSNCGKQLNLREARDEDGDTLIEVEPCTVCCPD